MICEDINVIKRAIENTRWEFDPTGFEGTFSLQGTNYKIKTYRALLEEEYLDILDFRRSFDYRLEAWKDAEKKLDGTLKKNNSLRRLLENRLKDWFEILKLEVSMRREIAEKRGFDSTYTLEQIVEFREIGEKLGWELKTIMCKTGNVHYYQLPHSRFPDLNYRIPIVCYSFQGLLRDLDYYHDNFDIEKETLAATIEKYGIADLKSPETAKLREQVREIPGELIGLILKITNHEFGNLLPDPNDLPNGNAEEA